MSAVSKVKVEVGTGKHVRQNLSKRANQKLQTGPPKKGTHSGVSIPKNRNGGGITSNH